ncbi:hypothetical protein NHQ30_004463 [Ciborinia camelliae]|nr:hypothetical protein NHQ30_004463 [Ciborinia camelliae]
MSRSHQTTSGPLTVVMDRAHQTTPGPLTEFTLFDRFPREIQGMIFEEAFPDPMIIELFTDFRPRAGYLWAKAQKHPQLRPFLLACKESNIEISRRFRKLEVVVPPSIRVEQRNNDLHSTYIRPSVDILLLQGYELGNWHRNGLHINLSNITYLALDQLTITSKIRSQHYEAGMRMQAELYTLLSVQCPALKKLYVLVTKQCLGHSCLVSPETQHRVMDMSDGIMDLDLYPREESTPLFPNQPFPNRFNFRNFLRLVHNDGMNVMKDFDRFLNPKEGDTWGVPGAETLKYWQNIRPTPGLLCIFEDTAGGEYSHPEGIAPPTLWVLGIGAFVACKMDGTPLHKYTGLAQIFDGAPW